MARDDLGDFREDGSSEDPEASTGDDIERHSNELLGQNYNMRQLRREITSLELEQVQAGFIILFENWKMEEGVLTDYRNCVDGGSQSRQQIDTQRSRVLEAKAALVEKVIAELLVKDFSAFKVLEILEKVVGGFIVKGKKYNGVLGAVRRKLDSRLGESGLTLDKRELDDPEIVSSWLMNTLEKICPCIEQNRLAKANEYAIAVMAQRLKEGSR